MRPIRTILMSLATLGTLIAGGAAAEEGPPDAPFQAINDRFNAAVAAGDLEAMLDLYAEDVLWLAPNAPAATGRDIARANYGFVFDNNASLSHTLDHVLVSDDRTQAVMIGTFSAPTLNIADKGSYLFVLENQNKTWKITADIFNSDQKN